MTLCAPLEGVTTEKSDGTLSDGTLSGAQEAGGASRGERRGKRTSLREGPRSVFAYPSYVLTVSGGHSAVWEVETHCVLRRKVGRVHEAVHGV